MKLTIVVVSIAVILQSGCAEVAEQNLRRGNLSPELTSNAPSTTATDVTKSTNNIELPFIPPENAVPSTGSSIKQPNAATGIARISPITSVNPTLEEVAAIKEAHDVRVQACTASQTMVKSSNTAKLIPQPTLIPIFAYASSTTTALSWWTTTNSPQSSYMSGILNFINNLYPPLAPNSFFYPLQQYFQTYSSGLQGGLYSTSGGNMNYGWTMPAGTTTMTQSTIEYNLRAWAGNGLPADVGQNIYVFFMPPNLVVTMTYQGWQSCSKWCGYHAVASTNGGTLRYMVLPYMASGGCNNYCVVFGGANPTDVVLTSYRTYFTHELSEAMTDPDININSGYTFPSGDEIGDVCLFQSKSIVANGVTYTVQKEWSNSACACI